MISWNWLIAIMISCDTLICDSKILVAVKVLEEVYTNLKRQLCFVLQIAGPDWGPTSDLMASFMNFYLLLNFQQMERVSKGSCLVSGELCNNFVKTNWSFFKFFQLIHLGRHYVGNKECYSPLQISWKSRYKLDLSWWIIFLIKMITA